MSCLTARRKLHSLYFISFVIPLHKWTTRLWTLKDTQFFLSLINNSWMKQTSTDYIYPLNWCKIMIQYSIKKTLPTIFRSINLVPTVAKKLALPSHLISKTASSYEEAVSKIIIVLHSACWISCFLLMVVW